MADAENTTLIEARRQKDRERYKKRRERKIATSKAWRLKNPERLKATSLEYEAKNAEKRRAARRARYLGSRDRVLAERQHWAWDNPEKVRANQCRYDWKKKKYPTPTRPRPDPEICGCCGNAVTGRKHLALDHNHTTNKFRGWLCNKCNVGIGMLGDCLSNVELAAAYLRKFDT